MASTTMSMKIEVGITTFFGEDNMFWLILGEENDIYLLTATLSVNAVDPHPP